MAKIPGAEFLGEAHPVGAQNKTLISGTDCIMLITDKASTGSPVLV